MYYVSAQNNKIHALNIIRLQSANHFEINQINLIFFAREAWYYNGVNRKPP